MSKIVMQIFFTCLIVCSSAIAAENEGERVGVASRTIEKTETSAQKRDITQQEEQAVTNAQEIVVAAEVAEEGENSDASKRDLSSRKTYLTTHNGAFHYVYAISFFGDTLELEDGSEWSISIWDQSKTRNWLSTDPIIILPNNSSFSYDYKLINTYTGATCEVNLEQGPYYNSFYRHWIVAIDYTWNEVWLEDGSFWKVTIFDDSKMQNWFPGDTIIIGINDDWLSSSRPNILINVNLDNNVRANCQ